MSNSSLNHPTIIEPIIDECKEDDVLVLVGDPRVLNIEFVDKRGPVRLSIDLPALEPTEDKKEDDNDLPDLTEPVLYENLD
jgi:hypothetical protein